MTRIIIPVIPVTKKNSQRIIQVKGRPMIIPSAKYKQYEKECGYFLANVEPILGPCNVQCVYFMPTRRKVDLVNLQEATLDVLVRYGILIDDNSDIVVSMDGSRVYYDKNLPRTEITITDVKNEKTESVYEDIKAPENA